MAKRDPAKQSEYFRRYYAANRERLLQYQRDYRSDNEDKVLADKRAYHAANRERLIAYKRERYPQVREEILKRRQEERDANRPAVREAQRRWYEANKLRIRAKRYGLTVDELRTLIARGQCDLCGRSDERLVVDHSRATGLVRGLLCDSCNIALGKFRDRPDVLMRAAGYVRDGGLSA